jgi:hypothetical protein
MTTSPDGAGSSSPASSAGHEGTPGPRAAADAPAPRLDEPPVAPAPPPSDDEEVDAWWGAYSGRALLPRVLGCVVLTGVIAWGTWLLAPPGWRYAAFLTLAGLLWAAEVFRWLWRLFGYNYRLTNRRLFQDRGVVLTNTLQADLAEVSEVVVEKSAWDRLVRVGRIRVVLRDWRRLVLDGVYRPAPAANLIRECVRKAREREEKRAVGGCPPAGPPHAG